MTVKLNNNNGLQARWTGTRKPQHHDLVKLINNLFDATADEPANSALKHIINELTVYLKLHFGAEEKYFDLSTNPTVINTL